MQVMVQRRGPDRAELGADLGDGPRAVGHQVPGIAQLVGRHDARAPPLAAPGTGGGQPLLHPLADDIALHLGKGGLDLQESPARRGRRVHRGVQRAEGDAPRRQLVDQRDQLARQPAQTVKVEHHKHVALAQEVETGRKAGPFGLGSRRAILEDPLAACPGQRVELAVQNLRPLGGGDMT